MFEPFIVEAYEAFPLLEFVGTWDKLFWESMFTAEPYETFPLLGFVRN